MNRRLLIRVATGASVAALATAGAAVAAGHGPWNGPNSGGPGPRGDLAAASTYLGISQSDLQADLQKGETLAQVANATSGKSASGLIAALVADARSRGATDPDLTAHITALVNGTAPPGGPGRGGPGPELSTAAGYLGISEATLRSDLESGKTLAQIADATNGRSASGLIDALVAADRTRITALVNGQLPQHP
jgi:D-Tyr-tRNAtyr deacylase